MPKSQTANKRRTLIKFLVKRSVYVGGEGANACEYKPIQAQVATDPDDNPIYTDCFYCEWVDLFGALAIEMEQKGVKCPARVRMTYVEGVYEALKSEGVRILKDGRNDEAHIYELNSSPTNELNENKAIEFQVKQYREAK